MIDARTTLQSDRSNLSTGIPYIDEPDAKPFVGNNIIGYYIKGSSDFRPYAVISTIKSDYGNSTRSSLANSGQVSTRKDKPQYLLNSLDSKDNINIEAKKCLEKIYYDFDSDVDVLDYAFESIEKAFAKHDLPFINTLLRNFEPGKSKTIVSTGILRATFRARTKLDSWKICAEATRQYLENKGEKSQHLLRGLIQTDDPITITQQIVPI